MDVEPIVVRAQAGERAALGELIDAYQSTIYSLTLSIMRDPADAADMTQDTFVRLVRSIATYRGDRASFTTWLHRLAINVCLDTLRRRKRAPVSLDAAAELTSADRLGDPQWHANWVESIAEVQQALFELPLPQRIALTLYYFEESSYERIAAVMGLPMNTVKSHLLRGKERMARLLSRPIPAALQSASPPGAFLRRRLSIVAA
jgi:RNA polymerase sigma-70 factor, ECF subfamily